jgi:hypothetical protein
MNKSDSTQKLFAAMAKAQAAIKHALHDSTNPHFRNDYATLESCIDAIKPACAEFGLSLIQGLDISESGSQVLTSVLTHDSGEWMSFQTPLILQKNDMQGLGSACTYARRYNLQGIFKIGDSDDDGNKASQPQAQTPKLSNGKYIIPFGKFKGQLIADCDPEELKNYGSWLWNQLKTKGEQPNKAQEEFFNELKKSLES